MKQTEKLDLILRELYKLRFDGHVYALKDICKENNIPIEPVNEVRALASRLKDDGYVNATFTFDDSLVEITSYGVEYCEEDSYTYKNHSIITNNYNLSITNSPNANIISNSSNVNISIANYAEIKNKFEQIREAIESENITEEAKNDLIECLNEVEILVDSEKKPKFAFKQLLEIGSSIAGVGSLIVELGKLIFGK